MSRTIYSESSCQQCPRSFLVEEIMVFMEQQIVHVVDIYEKIEHGEYANVVQHFLGLKYPGGP